MNKNFKKTFYFFLIVSYIVGQSAVLQANIDDHSDEQEKVPLVSSLAPFDHKIVPVQIESADTVMLDFHYPQGMSVIDCQLDGQSVVRFITAGEKMYFKSADPRYHFLLKRPLQTGALTVDIQGRLTFQGETKVTSAYLKSQSIEWPHDITFLSEQGLVLDVNSCDNHGTIRCSELLVKGNQFNALRGSTLTVNGATSFFLSDGLFNKGQISCGKETFIHAPSVKNVGGLTTQDLIFAGKEIVNTGSVTIGDSFTADCQVIDNQGAWSVGTDCCIESAEEFITGKSSQWDVAGTWKGSITDLYLGGRASIGTLALLDIGSHATFNGPVHVPIMHVDSRGIIVCNPHSEFFVSHHLGLTAQGFIEHEGDILEKPLNLSGEENSSDEVHQLVKLFPPGVFLYSKQSGIKKSGTIVSKNGTVALGAKGALIHTGLTTSGVLNRDSILLMNAGTLTLDKKSRLEALSAQLIAHDKICQEGKINIAQQLMMAAPQVAQSGRVRAEDLLAIKARDIVLQETSDLNAKNLNLNADETLDQAGHIASSENLIMRAKFLQNAGSIRAAHAKFNADRYFLNTGSVKIKEDLTIDALASINRGGLIETQDLSTHTAIDLNLLGAYRVKNSKMNSLIGLNAGLVVPQLNCLDDFFKSDTAYKAGEFLFSNFVPPQMRMVYGLAKTLYGVPATLCKGRDLAKKIYFLSGQKEAGVSDVISLLYGIKDFANSSLQIVQGGLAVPKALEHIDLPKSFSEFKITNNVFVEPISELLSLQGVPRVIGLFGPHFTTDMLLDLNFGALVTVNGHSSSLLHLNGGLSLSINNTMIDTRYGKNFGMLAAPNFTIQAAQTYFNTGPLAHIAGMKGSLSARNLEIDGTIGTIDRLSLQARKNARIQADLQGNGVAIQAPQVDLQAGTHIDGKGRALTVHADNITSDGAQLKAQGIQLQAKDAVSLHKGTRLDGQGKDVLVAADRVINSSDVKGKLVYLKATEIRNDAASQIHGKDIRLEAEKIIENKGTLNAEKQLGMKAKDIVLTQESQLKAAVATLKASETLDQKGHLDVSKDLAMRAKFLKNSGTIDATRTKINADRYFVNTGSLKVKEDMKIDALACVNMGGVVEARDLTIHAGIDINFFGVYSAKNSKVTSLIGLNAGLFWPQFDSWDSIFTFGNGFKAAGYVVEKWGDPVFSTLYSAGKVFLGLYNLAAASLSIDDIFNNKEAGLSDVISVACGVKDLAVSAGEFKNAACHMVTGLKTIEIPEVAQNFSTEISTEFFKIAPEVPGALFKSHFSRDTVLDTNFGATLGYNGNSRSVCDINAGLSLFGLSSTSNTVYGNNSGVRGSYALSINALETYSNKGQWATIFGKTARIETKSFQGAAASNIRTIDGAYMKAEALDNRGTTQGPLVVEFTGNSDQLKSIGQVDAQGGTFHYKGPIAQQGTLSTLPTVDELADGSGQWGTISNSGSISFDVGKDTVNFMQRHDIPHTLNAVTDGAITCHEPIVSEKSICLNAGGTLRHVSLHAGDTLQRIAGEDIIAQSTVERAQSGLNHEDHLKQVAITAGGTSVAIAARDILYESVKTASGQGGTHFFAGGTIVDKAVTLEKHEEHLHTGGHSSKRTVSTDTTAVVSQHVSKGEFIMQAGGVCQLEAPEIESAKPIIQGQQGVFITDVHDTHTRQKSYKKDGGWFATSRDVIDERSSCTSLGAQFKGGTPPEIISGGDITVVNVKSDSSSIILRPQGTAHMLLGKNFSSSSHTGNSSHFLWHSEKNSQSENTTYAPQSFTGVIESHAQKLLIESTRSDALGLAEHIKNYEGTTVYDFVDDVHRCDSHSSQGPTKALSAVIVLAVSLATAGTASSIGAGTAALLGCKAGTTTALVVSNMTAATFSAVAAQATLALVENQGDIVKAAESLATADTFKSVARSALTAGLMTGASQGLSALGLPELHEVHTLAGRIVAAAPRELVRAGVRTAVETAFSGEVSERTAIQNFRIALAGTLAAVSAAQIGAAYGQGDIGPLTHKVLHAASGAATGAIIDGASGAVAGGIGSLTAELTADLFAPRRTMMQAIDELEYEKGRQLTQEEFTAHYNDALESYMNKVSAVQDGAKLAAAVTTLFAGQDVDTGNFTASAALENNFLVLASTGIMVASTAYSCYQIHKAYEQGGTSAALNQLGIEMVTTAAGAATGYVVGQVAYKVGGIVYPSVKVAIEAALVKNPGLKHALGKLTDKLVIASEKFGQSAVGKGIARVESAIISAEEKVASQFNSLIFANKERSVTRIAQRDAAQLNHVINCAERDGIFVAELQHYNTSPSTALTTFRNPHAVAPQLAIVDTEIPFAFQSGLGVIEQKAIARAKLSEEDQLKIIDNLINIGARPEPSTRGRSTQHIRGGFYEDALKDFDRLGLEGINDFLKKDKNFGKFGYLQDGRKVTVRMGSSFEESIPNSADGLPTLEIPNPKNREVIKIRYKN